MIRLTIWYENVQEKGILDKALFTGTRSEQDEKNFEDFLKQSSDSIKKIYPEGLGETLRRHFDSLEDVEVRLVTVDMPEYGLTDELLEQTDVLMWWAHIAHDPVPDSLVRKIHNRVLGGMGFIALHSAHLCKPLKSLLGTGCTLRWREGDFERIWTTTPSHPITQGIPSMFELEEEEMYGEYFDIPKPDDVIFTGWFRGGEVFRSGCTWTRGRGKIFYFQPGHETSPSYHNPIILKVLDNAVRWAAPAQILPAEDCIHAETSPEDLLKQLTSGEENF